MGVLGEAGRNRESTERQREIHLEVHGCQRDRGRWGEARGWGDERGVRVYGRCVEEEQSENDFVQPSAVPVPVQCSRLVRMRTIARKEE